MIKNNNNDNTNNKKIDKIVHSCNLLRISFFKRCEKEDPMPSGI